MAKLPDILDPTLEAADRALEDSQDRRDRSHLGCSSIGGECDFALWASFRWLSEIKHKASTLKKFADGHAVEDVMVRRLRLVDGLTLLTLDPNTGRQYSMADHGGHFGGSIDGAVLGLLQAPKTWHVFEAKCCDQTKLNRLIKLKNELGEKAALAAWDTTYHIQAQLYMHYLGMARHWLVCSTPGGREWTGVRTEADPTVALRYVARARRIIFADRPPYPISDDQSAVPCKWCDHVEVCAKRTLPRVTCRSCLHSTPEEDGSWSCARWGTLRSYAEQQEACPAHLFNPGTVGGEQIDAAADGSWVQYRMADGSLWVDGDKPEPARVVERAKPCPACGSVQFEVEPGKGPHAAHLRCHACGRGGFWLSRVEAEAINAVA